MLNKNELRTIVNSIGENNLIEYFEDKRVCITGGLGFLGVNFIRFFQYLNTEILDNKPIRIEVFDSGIASSSVYMNKPYNEDDENLFVYGWDITDPEIIDSLEGADFILNAAGIASPVYYQQNPIETLDVCYMGTKNVLDAAINGTSMPTRVLQFSSSEIYGNPDPRYVPTPETYKGHVATMGPRSCYDEGKRVGEALCYTYSDLDCVDVVIVRPFNVYGPGMHLEDYRVIPAFANSILNNKPIKIHGTGTQTRTYCYLSDAIEGFIRALLYGNKGEVYNIGNPEPEISVSELATTMIKVSNRNNIVVNLINYPSSYPADEPMRRCPDITKAKQHLHYEPKVSLEEGLKRYFDHINLK